MSLITISRSIGCGGEEIAAIVAKNLKIDLYNDKRLQEEMLKMGIPGEKLESLEEKSPGLFDRLMGQKPQLYLNLMESVIYNVAKKGKGIVIGHGSPFLLSDFNCALHVLLFSSESFRTQQVMKEYKLKEEAALKLIHKKDNELNGYLRYAFHINWKDLDRYDLLINPEKIGIDNAAKMIIEAAKSDKIKECSLKALESMEKLSLLKKIEAALIEDNQSTLNIHIETTTKGKAILSGFVYSTEEKNQITKVVKGVPGISKVEANIAVVRSGY